MKRNALIRILAMMLSSIFICSVLAACAENNEQIFDDTSISDDQTEIKKDGHRILYVNSENGRIEGECEQYVANGGSSKSVKAIADKGYIFVGWSDGVLSDSRTETNVKNDISVCPVFKKIGSKFSITYKLMKDGVVLERSTKSAVVGEFVSYTAKDPDFAYAFEWEDGSKKASRSDGALMDGKVIVGNYSPEYAGAPAICITTEDGRGIESRTEYKSCTVSLVNADEASWCFEGKSAQIRGRGNSSWDAYDKKSFRLKFDKKISMLGSDNKDKSWIFVANHGDKSLLRNMIGYDLSENMSGLDFTVMHEFVDVYINGEYYGLFLLCDKIDAGKGRLEIDKNYYSDPAMMGYMIEIGSTDPGVEGVNYFRADGDYSRKYCINLPDTDESEYDPDVHLTYIEDYVEQCLSALSDENWELICELIDIDSFIDYYIIQEIFANKDAFWRSVHFYKEPGGKLFAGPIWDLDQGAGNVDTCYGTRRYDTTPDCDIDYANSEYPKESGTPWVAGVNTWYRRLMRNDEFKELLRRRLVEFGPILDRVLQKATTDGSCADSYYTLYSKAMNRNFDRWQIMGISVWPNTPAITKIDTVAGQIDYMREWLSERYDVLCQFYGVY